MRLTSVVGLMLMAVPVFAQRDHPVSVKFVDRGAQTRPGGKFIVTLQATIPSKPVEWHLYSITQKPGGPTPTTIRLLTPAFRLTDSIRGTKPKVALDPNFGMETETHTDSALYALKLVADPYTTGPTRLAVAMRYQVCNDRLCLPPVVDTAEMTVDIAGRPAGDTAWAFAIPTTVAPTTSNPALPPARTPPLERLPGNGSLALFLWIAATMGALSLLTPCVFPMVPITISDRKSVV